MESSSDNPRLAVGGTGRINEFQIVQVTAPTIKTAIKENAALFHHLEPSYYKALTSGVDNWQGEEMAALARSLPEDQLEPVLLALRQAPHLQALLLRERERCLRDRLTQPQRPPEAAPGGGVDSDL